MRSMSEADWRRGYVTSPSRTASCRSRKPWRSTRGTGATASGTSNMWRTRHRPEDRARRAVRALCTCTTTCRSVATRAVASSTPSRCTCPTLADRSARRRADGCPPASRRRTRTPAASPSRASLGPAAQCATTARQTGSDTSQRRSADRRRTILGAAFCRCTSGRRPGASLSS